MLNKKSIILAGLVLLGAGCTKQTQAFSFGDKVFRLVPVVGKYLRNKAKIAKLKEEKAELEKMLADKENENKRFKKDLYDHAKTAQSIREESTFGYLCSFFSKIAPEEEYRFKKDEQALLDASEKIKQDIKTSLNSINQQLEQLTGKK